MTKSAATTFRSCSPLQLPLFTKCSMILRRCKRIIWMILPYNAKTNAEKRKLKDWSSLPRKSKCSLRKTKGLSIIKHRESWSVILLTKKKVKEISKGESTMPLMCWFRLELSGRMTTKFSSWVKRDKTSRISRLAQKAIKWRSMKQLNR